MKKTKILVPAMGMLLLSTAASVTGTVAWFAANASVEASGMQLHAKSDTTYLLISKTNNTADDIQAENSNAGFKEVDFGMTANDSKVYPSAPALNNTDTGYLTTSGKQVGGATITTAGVIIDNEAKASAVTNWYTASALGTGAADIDAASARQLTSFTDYVIIKTVWLTIADGANPAHNLTVTPTFTQIGAGDDITAVKMLVTTDDGGFAALSSANNNTAVNIKGSDHTLDNTHVREIKMYLYYDGNDSKVYTNHMASLTGAEVELSFGVTAGEGTANA